MVSMLALLFSGYQLRIEFRGTVIGGVGMRVLELVFSPLLEIHSIGLFNEVFLVFFIDFLNNEVVIGVHDWLLFVDFFLDFEVVLREGHPRKLPLTLNHLGSFHFFLRKRLGNLLLIYLFQGIEHAPFVLMILC